MAGHIVQQFAREVSKAYLQGEYTFAVFNRRFILEHVRGDEWRVTTHNHEDIGFRFHVCDKKLSFELA